MHAFSPTGRPILGLAVQLPGRADAEPASFRRLPDGSVDCEWTGHTDLAWDAQVAETDADGHDLYLDDEGALWPAPALVLRDDAGGGPT